MRGSSPRTSSRDRRQNMAEILGLGCTHRPVMLRRNEDWTGMMRTSLDDPDMPAEMKKPANWPAPLREELGNDWGAAAASRAREVYRRHFAEARAALDAFRPDVIVMFGDDQYENFKEDVVPPFAVLAYDGHEIEPWKNRTWNPGANRTMRASATPATALPENTWLQGCWKPGLTRPTPIAPCTTRWVMPSPTRCCCSTTNGTGS